MKILVKAIHLYVIGLYAEMYKRWFDARLLRRVRTDKGLSEKRLADMSNKVHYLFKNFNKYECSLLHEINRIEGD